MHTARMPPLLHLDFKADNILLSASLTAKVADFGLSRAVPQLMVQSHHKSSMICGTPGYVCPMFMQHGIVSGPCHSHTPLFFLTHILSVCLSLYHFAPFFLLSLYHFVFSPSFFFLSLVIACSQVGCVQCWHCHSGGTNYHTGPLSLSTSLCTFCVDSHGIACDQQHSSAALSKVHCGG